MTTHLGPFCDRPAGYVGAGGERALDLFCKAGGASEGYRRAGFTVVGVDVVEQPHYPFDSIEADAITFLRDAQRYGQLDEYALIHASPPCQWGTAYGRRPNHVRPSLNLVAEVRELLEATGLPYVIEQPYVNRRALRAPITLCGSSFGLDVQRHRCFESNVAMLAPPCDHSWQTPRFPQATNRTNLRSTVEVGVWRIPLEVQKRAMGIDWMNLEELSEAVPPAYTEWIGSRLLAALDTEATRA